MARQKAGLGRGLNALLGVEEENIATVEEVETKKQPKPKPAAKKTAPKKEPEGEPGDSSEVSIDLIVPNPDQPRLHFDEEELSELADSIKKNGLLQPILVRKTGAIYQIIAGERRWQACKKIGMQKVPVRITEADDNTSITLAMIENIQRSDLNPMEEAYGYQVLMARNNLTQAELATAVSKGRSTIANSLRLLDLPEDAQQLLYEGKITAGHARAILSITSLEGRQQLTQQLLEQELTVRDAERIARLISGRATAKPARTPLPASYRKVAKNLKETLGTPVRVKSVKGKNKIEIDFKDESDLERIFKAITSE